jgi:hypothetical protein
MSPARRRFDRPLGRLAHMRTPNSRGLDIEAGTVAVG